MSIVTNEGWPEPNEWVQRLHDRLEALGADYIATPWAVADDPKEFTGLNLKQARATEILAAVASALKELPPFNESNGVAALHDIAGALNDVVMGGSPRLFTPVLTGRSGGGDGIYRNYIKVFVITSVRAMVEGHQCEEAKARKLVAKIFASAGATGRKGSPLSFSTVQDWCDRTNKLATNSVDVRIYREVEGRLANLQSDPQWPGSLQDTISWIERTASDPLLKSKYG